MVYFFRNIFWIAKNKKSLFEGVEKESFGRKLLALFSGYKINISKLENGHMFPLEDVEVNDEGTKNRKLLVFPNDEEREEIITRLTKNIEKKNLDSGIWATPGLPLLIFITFGFVWVSASSKNLLWFSCNILNTLSVFPSLQSTCN